MRKRWSLSVPMEGFALPELAEVAREAERLGYTDAWSFEVDGVDAFTPLTVVGLATKALVELLKRDYFEHRVHRFPRTDFLVHGDLPNPAA